jgi:photosystem II stability/assembly factor-like uncharacterized protein
VDAAPTGGTVRRRRRAAALVALAAIVVAVAGFAYLRPTLTPKRATVSTSIDQRFVANNPVSFDFVSPSMGWASLIFVGPSSEAGQVRVFRTVDGAKHWQQQLAGQSSSALTPGSSGPITVQFFGKTHGFMTLGLPVEQLYRTADGGGHWDAVSIPASVRIDSVTFVDATYGWLLAGPLSVGPQPISSGIQALKLYATRDGGSNWERLPDPPVDAAGLGFRRPTEAWMGGFGPGAPHVYTSSDAGQSWQRHDLPPPLGSAWTVDRYFPDSPARIQLLPGVGAIASVEVFNCVAESTASGSATCLNVTAVTFDFTSGDGGVTWRRVPLAPGDVAYQDSMHWWAVSADALFKSTDAGQSWKQVTATPPGWQFSVAGVLDSKHAWVSLFLVGGFGLALTSDGGLHWTLGNVPKPT